MKSRKEIGLRIAQLQMDANDLYQKAEEGLELDREGYEIEAEIIEAKVRVLVWVLDDESS